MQGETGIEHLYKILLEILRNYSEVMLSSEDWFVPAATRKETIALQHEVEFRQIIATGRTQKNLKGTGFVQRNWEIFNAKCSRIYWNKLQNQLEEVFLYLLNDTIYKYVLTKRICDDRLDWNEWIYQALYFY